MSTTDPFARSDAAYLLGALDADERDAFEAHLATCDGCRRRVEELRPVLAALHAADDVAPAADAPDADLPGTDLQDADPPPSLLPGLVLRAARERRRRRVVTGALAGLAAAGAVVTAAAVWPHGTDAAPTASARALTPVTVTPVRATARLVDETWGTRIDLRCRYATSGLPPVPYRLRVQDAAGAYHEAGAWTLAGSGADFTGGTDVRRDDIRSVEVTLADGEPVLRLTR